jgi:branched-chain amino acid aminotransferase
MKTDAVNLRVPFPQDPEWMEERLLRLVRANAADEATLRVVVVRNQGGIWQGPVNRDFDLLALTTALTRWGDSVRLGLVADGRFGRGRFAGTKITAWAHNLTWYEEAHEQNLDEVVLLDENGNVSECTSANVFAAFGQELVTPPLSSGCLPGVTRELLLHELRVKPYVVGERALSLADLEAADEVFITSTTRGVLPVDSVTGLRVRHNRHASTALAEALHEFMNSYVESRLAAPKAGTAGPRATR